MLYFDELAADDERTSGRLTNGLQSPHCSMPRELSGERSAAPRRTPREARVYRWQVLAVHAICGSVEP